MNEKRLEDVNWDDCPECSGKLKNVTIGEEDKLQCNQCRNFYVPLATTPFGELGRGWSHDDWEELHSG